MSETREIRQHIQNLEAKIALGDAAQRLMANPDFKKLILENLYVHRVIELNKQMGELPQDSQEYAAVLRELDSISLMRKYLLTIAQEAEQAIADLHDARAAFFQEDKDED